MKKPTADQLQNHLQNNSLFAGVEADLLKALVETAVWREYQAGETVMVEGGEQSGLYFVQFGWIKASKLSSGGREQVLRFLEPNETFNEVGVFMNQPNPVTATALERAGVWLIPRQSIRHLLRSNPDFAERVVMNMAERLLYMVSLATDLALRPISGRLARLLLTEAVDDQLHRPRWYTQTELAARLGTVSDVVHRLLRQMEQDGLIEVQRKAIRILDRQALADLAE